ncbi:MAG: hypothetical protein H6898_11720 [Rhodobacter sp.]|nr:hypothetical protein [Rhodobacter sp.]
MKTLSLPLAALIVATTATTAQTPQQGEFMGSTWGYYLLETGAAAGAVLTGRPSMYDGQPEAVITVVTRDGQSLTEADRDAAIALARALCIQSGREFSSTTRGHWLNDGGLGFHGACTR